MNRGRKHLLILILLFAGFVVVYAVNIAGWLMHDDEQIKVYHRP